MQIGITGASGFVGQTITAEAGREGHDIVAFSRTPDRALPGAAEVRDFSTPSEADFSGLDVLIHLAGEPILGLWTDAKKQRIRDSRVDGTRALVRAIEHLDPKERPKALICASATGFYGDGGPDPLDEDSDPGFGFLADVVREWEAAAEEAKGVGLRVVCGRIGIILGRNGGAIPLLRRVFGFAMGGRLGSGKQWMPWVHIDDIARMFVHCATDDDISGPVNFVAPHPVTNREFTRAIGATLKRPTVFPVPGFLLKAAPGGMHEMFLFSQRVDPTVLKLRDFQWRFSQIEPALADVLEPPGAITEKAEQVADEELGGELSDSKTA